MSRVILGEGYLRMVLPAQKYLDKVVVCRRARELGVDRRALKMRLGLYLSECSLA